MRQVLFLISLMLLVIPLPSEAQVSQEVHTDSVTIVKPKIFYRVNRVDIDANYMDNAASLSDIKRILSVFPRIDSITIHSFASPEGRYEHNRWLAAERGKSAKRYILKNLPEDKQIPDSLIYLRPTPENWVGMREEIVEKYPFENKTDVLDIIDRTDIDATKKESLLRRLDSGRSWRYIIKNVMPQLRNAAWISVWRPISGPVIATNVPPPSMSRRLEVEPLKFELPEVQTTRSKTILALKTNLLYDALTWLNYSIEVPIWQDKFSALVYHQFPWWRWGKGKNEYCIRFLGLGTEARWWFKPKPRVETVKRKIRDRFVGHYLGVYGESGKYDFERKRDICYQGEYWSVGLSYGYSFPIAKRLNLEVSLSAGYASIAYRGYTPSPDYSVLWRDYDKIGRWHYWGVTKVQVSLVVPIIIKTKPKKENR